MWRRDIITFLPTLRGQEALLYPGVKSALLATSLRSSFKHQLWGVGRGRGGGGMGGKMAQQANTLATKT